MPKTYDQAPEHVHTRVADLIAKHHPQLAELGVKVDLLMVSTDSETAPALTLGGYSCQAVVRSTNPKERASGLGDALIVIDRDNYDGLSDEECNALLDHELYHLVPKIDKKSGTYKRDEHGRPKLGIRKHDRQFGWFDEIARRHGEASAEVKQARWILDEAGHTYFGTMTSPADGPRIDNMAVTIRTGDTTVRVDGDGVVAAQPSDPSLPPRYVLNTPAQADASASTETA